MLTTVAQQKGGVGKTTTVINLGVLLARAGRRVLLIDTDPQAALTRQLGVATSPEPTLVDVLWPDPVFRSTTSERVVDVVPVNVAA